MNGDQDLSNFSMMALFCMEVEAHATVLSNNLLSLEADRTSTQSLQALMRSAHSIKGAARIVNLTVAVEIAHSMEDCFVSAQAGQVTLDADAIDALLQGVDWFLRLIQVPEVEMAAWLDAQESDIAALKEAIAALAEGRSAMVKRPPEIITVVESQPQSLSPVEDSSIAPAPSPPTSTATLVLDSPSLNLTSSSPNSERVIRISAENLNRLMGLAGESLVEANWLHPFADSLLKLKKQQSALSTTLDQLQENVLTSHETTHLTQQSQHFLNTARQQANDCRQLLNDRLNELEMFARRYAYLSDRLYREVIASHMRPFADGVQSFPRMVRDLARQLGKQVKVEILGKNTEIDRDILKKLETPLTHLLRNALDHGIELPQERAIAGKNPEGLVKLEASHRAGMLLITVSDDGQGINFEQLRQQLVTKQLVNAEMATKLNEPELLDFLFLPGFSTSQIVTEISGRGVGLDIVQSMVQELGGSLRTFSQSGRGMSFDLQLPLTLSVVRTLLVEIAGEPYAFPLTRIDQISLVPQSTITMAENHQYFSLNGKNIGLVAAHQVLDLAESSLSLENISVVVISDRLSCYGVVVDRFLGERDLVVRPLDARLGKVKNINASALLEDGSPVLLMDVEDMVRSIDHLLTRGSLNRINSGLDQTVNQSRKRILIVDDSITVREIERKLLQNKGYQVDVAVNGMDGWNAVRTGDYDLLVTDIDMPRMNGIELVSQIKQHPHLKVLPVIIVSYKDREEDRLRGLEVGADYYLTKSSFHDDTFITAVLDLIGDAG